MVKVYYDWFKIWSSTNGCYVEDVYLALARVFSCKSIFSVPLTVN